MIDEQRPAELDGNSTPRVPGPRRVIRPHPPATAASSLDDAQRSPPTIRVGREDSVPVAAAGPRPRTSHDPDDLIGSGHERELVRGLGSKTEFIRLRPAPARGGFRRRPGGVLEALPQATAPRGKLARGISRIKSVLVGAPLSTAQLAHERLSKTKALAVFSSDALSSSAYATEEILIVLALTGGTHLGLSVPIALAIATLLAIVAISYRQTIRAYPNGGGAYIVAKENLGESAGLTAAGALLVDYILTVSVSIAAGVAAIVAAIPGLRPFTVEMGVAAIALITLLNLRGVRESGTIFALPTYAFIVMGLALLVVGAIRVVSGAATAVTYEELPVATHGLTLFLVLRAFSSGCAALTGTEAISNGVPAFKEPESKNASTTLVWMAVILGTLFLGITFLSRQYALQPVEGQTIVSQLGRAIFGKNVIYYAWQTATALILLLAGNTSFADFPRLASLLAKDGFMPRQFAFRGDRLAFSNGIIVLGGASALILAVFGGEVTRLIPLYAVGVFVSFSLSQSGMVIHWRRSHEERGWRQSMFINGFGAVTTALVATIIIMTKLSGGAWISILMGIGLVFLFRAIGRHYRAVAMALALPDPNQPLPAANRPQTVLVPVRSLDRATVRALAYARSISEDVTALHVTDDVHAAGPLRDSWERWGGEIGLKIIESPYRSFTQPLLSYIDLVAEHDPEAPVTVVLPEFVPRHWWQSLLHGQDALRLKAALLFRPDTVVIDVPQHLPPRPGAASTSPMSGGNGVR